jgi:hypothetical protein
MRGYPQVYPLMPRKKHKNTFNTAGFVLNIVSLILGALCILLLVVVIIGYRFDPLNPGW